jgi:intein/homing endonuclease
MLHKQRKIKIKWTPNFAYAIGLITSDGNLSKEKGRISIKSADKELINNFKFALGLRNKNTKSARGGEKTKKYFNVYFRDINFYRFLNEIGLTPAKSKTIKQVMVPEKIFADFLRGLFDGDGTFYSFWDKRWSNSFVFQVSFASASFEFLNWLKNKLTELYGVRGFIRRGAGVFNLRYVKGDSRKLYFIMYREGDSLFLSRKYFKIRNVLEKDDQLHKLKIF